MPLKQPPPLPLEAAQACFVAAIRSDDRPPPTLQAQAAFAFLGGADLCAGFFAAAF
jgi:hypothetical protein